MNADSQPPPPSSPSGKPRPAAGALIGVAGLVLVGMGLFAAGAIAKVRQAPGAPAAVVMGFPAWEVATAGFGCTLAGGLWLRRLV